MPDLDEAETISKTEHIKRLNAKNSRIADLEEQLKLSKKAAADLESQMKVYDPVKIENRIAKLTEQRDSAVNELSDFRATTTTREALLTAGITDPEDQDLVRWVYGRLDEKGRPELGAWLAGGAKTSRALQGVFSNGADTATEAAQQAPADSKADPKPQTLPNVSRGVKAPAGPPAAMTLEAINQMSYADRAKPENAARIAEALASM